MFYIIPVTILVSFVDFTELRATILSSLHGFDESQTPLTSPIEGRVLTVLA